ncbi:hypothetical protein [Pontixanthobacter luteolus]|uniref:hypothetical protein n=1 Tax=Pontixanthobacter luteolus TaxID=295089 RepID=UPI0023038A26|nr:hypothetical protein [Pontixanthobacter luteolus]
MLPLECCRLDDFPDRLLQNDRPARRLHQFHGLNIEQLRRSKARAKHDRCAAPDFGKTHAGSRRGRGGSFRPDNRVPVFHQSKIAAGMAMVRLEAFNNRQVRVSAQLVIGNSAVTDQRQVDLISAPREFGV